MHPKIQIYLNKKSIIDLDKAKFGARKLNVLIPLDIVEHVTEFEHIMLLEDYYYTNFKYRLNKSINGLEKIRPEYYYYSWYGIKSSKTKWNLFVKRINTITNNYLNI